MADTTRLPVSRAKTVYGLLSEVIRLTDQEPKRMRMELWLDRWAAEHSDGYSNRVPACGTVGCIGGWMQALTGISSSLSWGHPSQFGLTDEMCHALFYDDCLTRDPAQGTRAHARKVIAHIKRFQKLHAKVLKATPVPRA